MVKKSIFQTVGSRWQLANFVLVTFLSLSECDQVKSLAITITVWELLAVWKFLIMVTWHSRSKPHSVVSYKFKFIDTVVIIKLNFVQAWKHEFSDCDKLMLVAKQYDMFTTVKQADTSLGLVAVYTELQLHVVIATSYRSAATCLQSGSAVIHLKTCDLHHKHCQISLDRWFQEVMQER